MRTIANFGLSLLLVAVLLWGGCISCSQYFQFSASHGCCDPVGHCRRTPVSKTCSIQPMQVTALAHSFVPDATVAPVILAPPVPVFAVLSEAAIVKESPPDLCKLHSVFRV
jgi:hypothetical protein